MRGNKQTTKLLKQWTARGRSCVVLKAGGMQCELMKAEKKEEL